MKYFTIAVIALILVSVTQASFLKKTEAQSCQLYSWYSLLSCVPTIYNTCVYTYPEVYSLYYYTPTYVVPTLPTVTLSTDVVFLAKKAAEEKPKQAEKLLVSVIHDKHLKDYDIKGNLFHRDEVTKENWFAHGKIDEKTKTALKSCRLVNDEVKKDNFKGVVSKITNKAPEFLIPKKASFKRNPKIEDNKEEKKVEVAPKRVEEKKVVEKKVEEKKVEEKKVEVKKPEERIATNEKTLTEEMKKEQNYVREANFKKAFGNPTVVKN